MCPDLGCRLALCEVGMQLSEPETDAAGCITTCPTCIPIIDDVCAGVECAAGETCVISRKMCLVAPCAQFVMPSLCSLVFRF